MKFSVFAGVAAIVVFSAVAFALALYAFMKLHGQECHYACPEIDQPICAYQKEEQKESQTSGMNFSSVCNRDMYNCQNPAHSFSFYTKGSCSNSY